MRKLFTIVSVLFFSSLYSQNVGIGTNTPAFKLDVQGRMRVKTGTLGNLSTTSGIWMEDYRDGTNRLFFGMQDSIRGGFYGSGTGGAGWQFNFNTKTGNVGIGKTAEGYRLELDDVSGAGIGLFNNGTFGGALSVTDTTMEITPRTGSSLCFPNPCPASDLILIPPVSNFNSSGNVGIGTNLPLAKLSVINNGEVVSEFANSSSLSNGTDTKILFKTGNWYTGAIGTYGTGSNTSRLGLSTYAGVSSNTLIERLSILDNGYIGIGTTTPKVTLHVNGGISLPIKRVTSDYTIQNGDYTIIADLQDNVNININIYLPLPENSEGRILKIFGKNLPNLGYGPQSQGIPNGRIRIKNSTGTVGIATLSTTFTDNSFTNGAGRLARDYFQLYFTGITLHCDGVSWIITDSNSGIDTFYDSYNE